MSIPLDKKYSIIYADPPWLYNDKGGRSGAEKHYVCTSTDEMCKWEIPAEENSVCLMWCTYPQLKEGLKLIEAWGFKFKTVAFTWVKTNKNGSVYMGMGWHTRANAEICLLGVKGKGLKRINAGIPNTQLHPREDHSKKPDAFRKSIERLYGNVPRIELFARQKADGWMAWGNEV
ncbi:MAG: MT-A70 family methyltransferase [Candidatus Paceibacterota bacterium]